MLHAKFLKLILRLNKILSAHNLDLAIIKIQKLKNIIECLKFIFSIIK